MRKKHIAFKSHPSNKIFCYIASIWKLSATNLGTGMFEMFSFFTVMLWINPSEKLNISAFDTPLFIGAKKYPIVRSREMTAALSAVDNSEECIQIFDHAQL